VQAVAFSPDGSQVLTGSDDGTARLWSAQDGKPIGEAMRHASSVLAVAFSPGGSRVLTGSDDGTARLWSAQDGKPIGEAMRHADWVQAVAFSPDGSQVLTGSDDGTARLWSAQDGKPIGEAMRHPSIVRAVAFSPDGSKALALTQWWLHASEIPKDNEVAGLPPVINRMLPNSLATGRPFRFLDPAGRDLQIAVRPTADRVQVVRLRLDRPDAAPLAGDPAQLLADWQRRLGLKINDAGEIVPLWP
jgi:hypothetical protein